MDNIESRLKCPVCNELPATEIYQCQAGHTICSECLRENKFCAKCKVKFKDNPTRNLAFESLLDSMSFSCPMKIHGCRQSLKRREIKIHIEKMCTFNKDAVKLCPSLGFVKCKYAINPLDVPGAILHLQDRHGCVVRKGNSVDIHYDAFYSKMEPKASQPGFWQPVVLEWTGHEMTMIGYDETFGYSYYSHNAGIAQKQNRPRNNAKHMAIIVCMWNEKIDGVSWNCIFVSPNITKQRSYPVLPYYANFRIENDKQTENSTEWTVPTIQLSKAESRLKVQSVLISLSSLEKERSPGQDLKMNVIITDSNPLRDAIFKDTVGSPKASPAVSSFCLDGEWKNQNDFKHITCGYCKSAPKGNKVYNCLRCPSYYLCEGCMEKNPHADHVFAVLRNANEIEMLSKHHSKIELIIQKAKKAKNKAETTPDSGTIFTGVSCMKCNQDPINDVRYKCVTCRHFNLCKSCIGKIHTSHVFAMCTTLEHSEFVDQRKRLQD